MPFSAPNNPSKTQSPAIIKLQEVLSRFDAYERQVKETIGKGLAKVSDPMLSSIRTAYNEAKPLAPQLSVITELPNTATALAIHITTIKKIIEQRIAELSRDQNTAPPQPAPSPQPSVTTPPEKPTSPNTIPSEVAKLQEVTKLLQEYEAQATKLNNTGAPPSDALVRSVLAAFTTVNSISPSLNLAVSPIHNPTLLLLGISTARLTITARITELLSAQAQPPAANKQPPPPEEPKPKQTSAATERKKNWALNSVLGSLAATVATLLFSAATYYFSPSRPTAVSYTDQMKSLDRAKGDLEQLSKFIDEQKKQVASSQQAVEALKTEEGRMQPLVQADKKVIDAVFAEQERRNQASLSGERWIGFGLGFVASLIASFVFMIVMKFLQRKNEEAEKPE